MLLAVLATTQMLTRTIRLNHGGWQLESGGHVVLIVPAEQLTAAPKLSRREEAATPVFLGYPHGPKDAQFVPPGRLAETYRLEVHFRPGIKAEIQVPSGLDSFACSADLNQPLGSAFGRPTNDNFDSIYNRAEDWLLGIDGKSARLKLARNGYTIDGPVTALTFRPEYYRDHLGYFLWDRAKPLWTKPIAGWCSWMAYLQDVKQEDIEQAADFFAKNLRDYGYRIIQIDDGYQRVLQNKDSPSLDEPFASYWTKPNPKFPDGMAKLAQDIRAKGLTPGIWIGDYLPLGLKHRDGYVTDSNGQPHKGPWVGYAVNGHNRAAIDEGYVDTIREFKRQGWDYFKIDTLRHVLYDNYRQAPEYWKLRGESMEDAFRAILAESKRAAGSSYLMACWGTLPELAGLPDGARIGEDVGPDVASMRRSAKYIAQFQYLNNVVWRNDPDYMCLRVPLAQARAWASLTFLAGGHVMVSDPISAYDSDRVDILRRVGPPIFTRPNTVVSHALDPEFLTLTCEKNGEEWQVIGRFAWEDMPASSVPIARFGLSPIFQHSNTPSYLGFDFWQETPVEITDSIPFHALKSGECQVVCIRKRQDHPQVLGTNRHLSQGAFELSDVLWRDMKLTGTLQAGLGRRWSLVIHVPAGYRVGAVEPMAASHELVGETLRLTFPETDKPVKWAVEFSRS